MDEFFTDKQIRHIKKFECYIERLHLRKQMIDQHPYNVRHGIDDSNIIYLKTIVNKIDYYKEERNKYISNIICKLSYIDLHKLIIYLLTNPKVLLVV